MNICSWFNSFDGEWNGFENAGQPSTFIRFQGCNLKCVWCDTQYANNPKEGRFITPEGLLKEIGPLLLDKVTLTGGEPLAQPHCELKEFISLLPMSEEVSIETNGSIDIPKMLRNRPFSSMKETIFVVDFKLPSSDMCNEKRSRRICKTLKASDGIKFVVGDLDKDLSYLCDILNTLETKAHLIVSALPKLRTTVADQILVAVSIEKIPSNILYNIQLHKVLWPQATGANNEH